MEWNNNDLKSKLVSGYTSWFFIYDFTELKEGNAVYIFANSAHQVKFISSVKQGKLIDGIANAVVEGKDVYSNLVMAIYSKTYVETLELKKQLIAKYKPTNNGEPKRKKTNEPWVQRII